MAISRNHYYSVFFIIFILLFLSSSDISIAKEPVNKPIAWKFIVTEPGMYKVTFDDLIQYGISPEQFDLSKISIQHRGIDIPIYTSRTAGIWAEDDYIKFYGDKPKTSDGQTDPFTRENVYWLLNQSDNPIRIKLIEQNLINNTEMNYKEIKYFIDTLHLEVESLQRYQSNYPRVWYWKYFVAPTTHNVDLWHLNWIVYNEPDNELTATIQVKLQGESRPPVSPAHHAVFRLNDTFIGEAFWDGQNEYIFDTEFPVSLFRPNNNVLSIEATGKIKSNPPMDIFLSAWIRINYPRKYRAIYDVIEFSTQQYGTDTNRLYKIDWFSQSDISIYNIQDGLKFIPTVIPDPGRRNYYMAKFIDSNESKEHYIAVTPNSIKKPIRIEPIYASDLKNPINSADYVILTYDDFAAELYRLAEYRAKQGHQVKIVRISDVYNEFNYGIFSPEAIRSFVEYAYHHWAEPQLQYLFLIGDANWDYKNNMAGWLGMTTQNFIPTNIYRSRVSYIATDDLFVTLDENSPYPTIAIGRLTARTSEDVRNYIDKIIAYETSPDTGWVSRAIMVGGYEPMFTVDLDNITRDLLLPNYDVTKAYAIPAPEFTVGGKDEETRKLIRDLFHDGLSMVYFSGHGTHGFWADRRLLTTDDIKEFNNKGKYPIVLSMTCFTGWFEHPTDVQGVCELLVNKKDGGAIAALGATGRSGVHSNSRMGRGIFNAMLIERKNILGDIILAGKRAIHPSDRDGIYMYILFGDPALRVRIPENNIRLSLHPADDTQLVITGKYDILTATKGELELLDKDGNIIYSKSISGNNGSFKVTIDTSVIEDKKLKYIQCSIVEKESQLHKRGWITVSPADLIPKPTADDLSG